MRVRDIHISVDTKNQGYDVRRFLAVYNLVQKKNKNPFTSGDITPLHILYSNLSVRRPVIGEIFLLKRVHFWSGDTIRDTLVLFYQDLHNFYSIFRILKSGKKDENIISCTRFYVDSTDTLMGQRRESIIIIPTKDLFDNMWRQTSFLIITTSKGIKKVWKKQKTSIQRGRNWIQRAFPSTLCYHSSFPSSPLDLSCLSYPLLANGRDRKSVHSRE